MKLSIYLINICGLILVVKIWLEKSQITITKYFQIHNKFIDWSLFFFCFESTERSDISTIRFDIRHLHSGLHQEVTYLTSQAWKTVSFFIFCSGWKISSIRFALLDTPSQYLAGVVDDLSQTSWQTYISQTNIK